MGVLEFRDDDRGYRDWINKHDDGYVINIAPNFSSDTARLHRATCHTITGDPPGGRAWTDLYMKLCSLSRQQLAEWIDERADGCIQPCGICRP